VSSARFDDCRARQSHRGNRLTINDSFCKGNQMKKLLTLASLSVASVALLAGCEKPAPAPAPAPMAAPAPAPAPPPAEAPAPPPAAAPEQGKEMKK
jgi:hypothetical protein